eukprot:TRINITY_DN44023_c0_g1_i1.p1 TRINITY_DN44023_c0_g1~~TRINITY_DN44023_c0_g1_i1.p1  ORF type:complete len:155 (+),score=72.93 TRINITY_DN44023_c0_g1_i1:226-690(+)
MEEEKATQIEKELVKDESTQAAIEASRQRMKEAQASFDDDLSWCLRQLKLGLKRKDATDDQKKESQRVIKTLESKKATVARKRSLMHVVFGDYRKLIEDEKKRKAEKRKEKGKKKTSRSKKKSEKEESRSFEREEGEMERDIETESGKGKDDID